MILIKLFSAASLNPDSKSIELAPITQRTSASNVNVNKFLIIFHYISNHIIKFKILYIIIIIIILLLPFYYPIIRIIFTIIGKSMGRDYGDENASSSLFESIFNHILENQKKPSFFHLRHQVRLLKFYSSLWPFYICNKPSVALEFFLLDETSSLQDLEFKKNLKVGSICPEEYKQFDPKIQFLKNFLKIQYYYCIAKKHINEKGAKKWNKIDLESELKRIQSFKLILRPITIDIDFYKCINGDSTGWVTQQDMSSKKKTQ